MKEFFHRHKWKLLGASAFFLIVVPALINLAFKLHAPCGFLAAEWSAGDVLSFYGAMLASVATIMGVYLSIDYAQRNYREDEANRVRPYLALTHYKSKSRSNLLSLVFQTSNNEPDRTSDEFYEEYKLDKVFIIIGTDGISFKDSLTDAQKQSLQAGSIGMVQEGNSKRFLCPRNLVSMPFEIENVGSGAALNTMVGFYKAGAKRRGVNIFTMKTGQSAYCHIFCDEQNSALYGEYILEFIYGDILGNRYSQKYNVEFGIDAENGKFFNSINLVGEQKREP
ncbi:hypothetical protein [Dysosmobacter sp. Phy]